MPRMRGRAHLFCLHGRAHLFAPRLSRMRGHFRLTLSRSTQKAHKKLHHALPWIVPKSWSKSNLKMNGKCVSPAHLWLTGCLSEIGTQLQRLSGYDKWIIEKENRSYIETFQDQKENLVYLTADAENILEDLDANRIYIIGGLVDRNRWKGITMKKAKEQGIQSARLPIGDYIKLASSQVLTVNQVVEILLKFLETRDWKTAFFHVIPQRKRGAVKAKDDYSIDIARIDTECKEADNEEGLYSIEEVGEEDDGGGNVKTKKQRFGAETEEKLT